MSNNSGCVMHCQSHLNEVRRLVVAVVLVWGWVFSPVAPELLRADDIKPEVGFGIALTGPSGVYSYVPDKWGVLHVHLVNRKQVPLELLAATYFEH